MIILNKPYVSDFLVETIDKNNFTVLDNEIARKYFPQERLTKTNDAVVEKLFYSNSENSIDWILENMADSELACPLLPESGCARHIPDRTASGADRLTERQPAPVLRCPRFPESPAEESSAVWQERRKAGLMRVPCGARKLPVQPLRLLHRDGRYLLPSGFGA